MFKWGENDTSLYPCLFWFSYANFLYLLYWWRDQIYFYEKERKKEAVTLNWEILGCQAHSLGFYFILFLGVHETNNYLFLKGGKTRNVSNQISVVSILCATKTFSETHLLKMLLECNLGMLLRAHSLSICLSCTLLSLFSFGKFLIKKGN